MRLIGSLIEHLHRWMARYKVALDYAEGRDWQPVSITASATSRRKLPLLTIIDHNCTGAAASQPNRGFLESPHALCTRLLAVVQTI